MSYLNNRRYKSHVFQVNESISINFISANTVPSLDALDYVNVTVGVEVMLTVTVDDSDDDTFTFENKLPDDASFTVSGNKGLFRWTPSTRTAIDGLQ